KSLALQATPSRFLAAGYVIVIPTFRSRRKDPQTRDALEDSLAIVRYVKKLPEVDSRSVAVYGCSGGGSLALELAGEIPLAAAGAEEPATVLFTGMLNKNPPKKGVEFDPSDAQILFEQHRRFLTRDLQLFTREKMLRIQCPILVTHGDSATQLNRFNNDVFIPHLRQHGKKVEAIGFPGEPHCFGIWGDRRPEASRKLFEDTHAFFKRHLPTQPAAVDRSLVTEVPFSPQAEIKPPANGAAPVICCATSGDPAPRVCE
ncbi:MAG: alpha/beta hydrolase family protein, partial [Bryobacteraceae bacterium]